jgi:hypothetical protein
VIDGVVACPAPCLPQSFFGSLVPWIEGQYHGQVGQNLAGIAGNGSPLQPRLQVARIQFQDRRKIALGTGALTGSSGPHAPFHEHCGLFLYVLPSGAVGRQMNDSSLVGLRSS